MLSLSFNPFPVLTTERLSLRRIGIEDAKEIFFLRTDEAVNKFLDRPKAASIEDAIQFINKINEGIHNNELISWVINFKNHPILMGTIGLWNISRENCTAEIGYELNPEFQGKGIMQEAFPKVISFGFEIMKLRTIEAHTTDDNKRSINLLEKNGFIVNGSFKDINDASTNIIIYSLNNKPK
jgi:ribosomal-protein-alanine N-acetyltransferase